MMHDPFDGYDFDDMLPVRLLADALKMHSDAAIFAWNGEWEDAPYGGESCWFGWSDMMPAQSVTGTVRRYLQVPVTTWGDYVGSTVERSNWRTLHESFPETFVDMRSDFDSHSLVLPLSSSIPAYLARDLYALATDYPLWDEGDEGALTLDLMHEDWQTWARDEFRRDVKDALTDGYGDVPDEWMPTDAELDAYAHEHIAQGYYCETAVRGTFGDMTGYAEEYAAGLVAEWMRPAKRQNEVLF